MRHIKEMFRLLFDGKSSRIWSFFFSKHYQCHWQVRVGTGNIAGVTFEDGLYLDVRWLLWSRTAFVKLLLAQIYKEKHLGEFQGGPAFISRGLGVKMVYCIFICRGFYHFGRCIARFNELCCRRNTECL
jgi:AGCS family alanine or glycine:cation symporter